MKITEGRGAQMYNNHNKNWTEEQKIVVMDYFGDRNIQFIARKVGKRETAVKTYATRILGLGKAIENSAYINMATIAKELKVRRSTVYYWFKYFDFPSERVKITGGREFLMADPKKMWEWLGCNRERWDAAKLERYSLGAEPDWLNEKRRKDIEFRKLYPNHGNPWTTDEKERAWAMCIAGISNKNIAQYLGRTEEAISSAMEKYISKKAKGEVIL